MWLRLGKTVSMMGGNGIVLSANEPSAVSLLYAYAAVHRKNPRYSSTCACATAKRHKSNRPRTTRCMAGISAAFIMVGIYVRTWENGGVTLVIRNLNPPDAVIIFSPDSNRIPVTNQSITRIPGMEVVLVVSTNYAIPRWT